jgi:putative ABC transport system substrate-binding protein
MDRRAFISGITVGLLAAPPAAEAQPPGKIPKVGWLAFGSSSSQVPYVSAFRDGLRQLGYVEGNNIAVEYRFAEASDARLPGLAAELVRMDVEVIVTSGARVVRALLRATRTIPIVAAVVGDPVGAGFVASFARPDGNITGLAFQDSDLVAKRLQLLKEIRPEISRVAVLYDPDAPAGGPPSVLKAAQEAARILQLKLQVLEVRAQVPGAIEQAFEAAKRGHAQAIVQLGSPFFNANRTTMAALALKAHYPMTCEQRHFVTAGCLTSYGPDFDDMYRRTAAFVETCPMHTRS